MSIADELMRPADASADPSRRWGKVTDVAGPVLVQFAGDTTDTPIGLARSTYTPTVDDIVVVDRVGTRWVIAYAVAAI